MDLDHEGWTVDEVEGRFEAKGKHTEYEAFVRVAYDVTRDIYVGWVTYNRSGTLPTSSIESMLIEAGLITRSIHASPLPSNTWTRRTDASSAMRIVCR